MKPVANLQKKTRAKEEGPAQHEDCGFPVTSPSSTSPGVNVESDPKKTKLSKNKAKQRRDASRLLLPEPGHRMLRVAQTGRAGCKVSADIPINQTICGPLHRKGAHRLCHAAPRFQASVFPPKLGHLRRFKEPPLKQSALRFGHHHSCLPSHKSRTDVQVPFIRRQATSRTCDCSMCAVSMSAPSRTSTVSSAPPAASSAFPVVECAPVTGMGFCSSLHRTNTCIPARGCRDGVIASQHRWCPVIRLVDVLSGGAETHVEDGNERRRPGQGAQRYDQRPVDHRTRRSSAGGTKAGSRRF